MKRDTLSNRRRESQLFSEKKGVPPPRKHAGMHIGATKRATLSRFGADPKRLGGRLDMTAVRHTWGQERVRNFVCTSLGHVVHEFTMNRSLNCTANWTFAACQAIGGFFHPSAMSRKTRPHRWGSDRDYGPLYAPGCESLEPAETARPLEVPGELLDWISDFLIDGWTAGTSMATECCPIVTEAFALPRCHGRRLNQFQRLAPF